MEIKLCRIFNVFGKSTLFYSTILFILTLILGIIYHDFWNVLITPIFSFFYSYNYSKFLKVDYHAITYRDFKTRSNFGNGRHNKFIYTIVTLRVEQIEFKQNRFEKFFNAGHIKVVDENSVEHYIYGITHFDTTKFQIENKLLYR